MDSFQELKRCHSGAVTHYFLICAGIKYGRESLLHGYLRMAFHQLACKLSNHICHHICFLAHILFSNCMARSVPKKYCIVYFRLWIQNLLEEMGVRVRCFPVLANI